MNAVYVLICWFASIGMKNGTEPIALNALSSRLEGRKRFFSAAGVFLPVTFVASTSPRLTFPILGHPVDEEERRALNAYRFPYTTYVTSFLPIYVLLHAHNGQSTISIPTCTRLFSILISRFDPGQRAKVSVSKVKKTFRTFAFGHWLRTLTHANFQVIASNNHFFPLFSQREIFIQ